jgi:hypothetical protein
MSHIVRVTPRTTEQLNTLTGFLKSSDIPYVVVPASPATTAITDTDPILYIDSPPTLYKPTSEFKLFLGPEYMTQKQYVVFKDVLHRVYNYVKRNDLLTYDQAGFRLDATLRNLLKTHTTQIEWTDLIQHIDLLFTRVP